MGWAQAQIIDISTARGKAIGEVVEVRGVVQNGPELGLKRAIYDGTAAISVYPTGSFIPQFANVKVGDSIRVKGKLSRFPLNTGLLEVTDFSSFQIINSGNPLPEPLVINADELSAANESRLVRINRIIFDNGGNVFSDASTYTFVSENGKAGQMYVRREHPLVGSLIPTGPVDIVGISGLFRVPQIELRTLNDVIQNSSIFLTSPVRVSDIQTTSLRLNWQTNITAQSSYIEWGLTPQLEKPRLTATVAGTANTVDLTGLTTASIVYVRGFSVANGDTTFSKLHVFATRSLSAGWVKTYFTKCADSSVAKGNKFAIWAERGIDDTLIAYLGKAKKTIDLALYNINNVGLSNMTAALNAAFDRGVQVRIVGCASTAMNGLNTLKSGIRVIKRPEDPERGIMHNKFVIIDAESENPNEPIVWTGSTNLTRGQINDDYNHVIVIQDQTLARAYTLEFNEMFGSTTATPNSAQAAFGQFKRDNTPHEFIIGGKYVKQYFSPSDNVNFEILNVMNRARSDLRFAVMVMTRADLINRLCSRKTAGLQVKGVINNDTVPPILKDCLRNDLVVTDINNVIMHHKYMLADVGTPNDSTLVLTGSHNWSSNAEQRNDENTLIIYDAELANVFYQEFEARFRLSTCSQVVSRPEGEPGTTNAGIEVFPNPSTGQLTITTTDAPLQRLRLLNLAGAEVWQARPEGTFRTTVEPRLPAGLYLLEITTDRHTHNQKVVLK
jgi:hypothetical protein